MTASDQPGISSGPGVKARVFPETLEFLGPYLQKLEGQAC